MDSAVSFAYYAALVKNLRGVLLFDPGDEGAWSRVSWLRRRFRYRNLGVTPSVSGPRVEDLLESRVFRRLYYPLRAYEEFVGVLRSADIDGLFAEAAVLSSAYISPLLLLSEGYLDLVRKYSLGEVRVCKELGDRDWKLHIRIADYSILDSYETMVERSIEYVRAASNEEVRERILTERRAFVEKDSRRYWRIACNEGDPFLLYLDPLLILGELPGGMRGRVTEEHAAALAVVPAVNVCLVGGGFS